MEPHEIRNIGDGKPIFISMVVIRMKHMASVSVVNWCSPAPLTCVWVRHKGGKGMKLLQSMDLRNNRPDVVPRT